MMRRARGTRLVALSTLLMTALPGCASQPGSTPARPIVSASLQGVLGLDAVAIDMITDSGGYPDRKYLVETADERVTAECMRSAGFTWSGFVYKPPPGSDEDRALDLDDRRKRGYGVADPGQEPQPQIGGPDDGRSAALFGKARKLAKLDAPGFGQAEFPVEGCLAQAHAAIFGDVATWARLMFLPQGANAILARTTDGDPRLLAAGKAWSRCMKDHGYRYAKPGEIRSDLQTSYRDDPDPVQVRQDKEIKLALQDAACDRKVGLARTELDLRRAAARMLPADQRSDLAHLAISLDEAVGRAHATVERPAPAQ